MNKKIGFIGTGNMGRAMIGGLITNKTVSENQIFVSDKNEKSLSLLKAKWKLVNCSADNLKTVKNSDILILAVKPDIYKTVINEINSIIEENQIIITIAAGISINKVESMFAKEVKIIRTMPNTPALVGEGVTGFCCNSNVSEVEEKMILPLLNSFGIVEKIEEKHFDALIALSGSSPALAL